MTNGKSEGTMSEPIEQLKEIPAPPPTILPRCDIRYITLGLYKHEPLHWSTEFHKNLTSAQNDTEWYVPGTMRIFEIPEAAP
jgi:hypothetical protein